MFPNFEANCKKERNLYDNPLVKNEAQLMDGIEDLLVEAAKVQAKIIACIMENKENRSRFDPDDAAFLEKKWRKSAETATFLGISKKTLLRKKENFTYRKVQNYYLFSTESTISYLNGDNHETD